MLIRLKRVDRKEDKSIMFDFPYDESEVFNVYNQLELETSTAPNCYIEEVVYDSDMNEVLKGKECNICSNNNKNLVRLKFLDMLRVLLLVDLVSIKLT